MPGDIGMARFKVNVKKVPEVDSFLDKDVVVGCEVGVFNEKPILRIVSIRLAK